MAEQQGVGQQLLSKHLLRSRRLSIMSRTKSSHSGHYETSVLAIWDIMRPFYMGTVWDYSGHYETFSWDISRLCAKIFFGCFAPLPPPLCNLQKYKVSLELLGH